MIDDGGIKPIGSCKGFLGCPLFGADDIAGALGDRRIADLVVEPLGHFAVMDKAVGARKDVGAGPDEGVILASDDDCACVESQMTDDGFRDRDTISIYEVLRRDWRNVDNQALGAVSNCKHKAWPCLATILTSGLGLVTPEIAVVNDITRYRFRP